MSGRHRWLRFFLVAGAAVLLAFITRALVGPVMVWREVNIGSGTGFSAKAVRWGPLAGTPNGAWLGDGASESEWIDLPAVALRWIALDGPFDERTPPPTVLTGFLGVSWTTDLGPATPLDHAARWDTSPDLMIVACDIAGLAALWAGLIALLIVVWRARGEEPFDRPRSRRHWPAWAALGVVAGVNAAVATRLPVMYPPDAAEYAANAITLHQTGSLVHFGSWRLPGFSVVLAPLVAWFHDFGVATGWLNAAAVIAAAAGAGLALRRVTPPWFAAAGVLVVGLHPLLLLYQRQAMPEVLAAAVVTLVCVGAIRSDPKAVLRAAWTYALLGGVLGLAAYLRANFQLLILWLPIAGAVGAASLGRRRVALTMLAAGWFAGACVLAPWLARNERLCGRASLVVGGGYTRALSACEVGWLDADQMGLFDRPQWIALRSGEHANAGPFQRLDAMRSIWKIPAGEAGRAEFDASCGTLTRESAARHPARRWTQAARAFASVSGLWPVADPGYRENEYWARPLAGETGLTRVGNHWTGADEFRELSPARAREVIARTARALPTPRESRVCSSWFALAAPLRVVVAWLAALGALGAWRDTRRTVSLVFATPFVHAAGLAAFAWTGIDRYGVPLIPIQIIGAVYGVWWMVRQVRSRTHAAPTAA